MLPSSIAIIIACLRFCSRFSLVCVFWNKGGNRPRLPFFFKRSYRRTRLWFAFVVVILPADHLLLVCFFLPALQKRQLFAPPQLSLSPAASKIVAKTTCQVCGVCVVCVWTYVLCFCPQLSFSTPPLPTHTHTHTLISHCQLKQAHNYLAPIPYPYLLPPFPLLPQPDSTLFNSLILP